MPDKNMYQALKVAANTTPQMPIGITAEDVLNQKTNVSSPQDFLARGGVTNTVMKGLNDYQRQRDFKNQLKQMEELIAKNMNGAKSAYDEAVSNNEELKNWIPRPELFVDDNTGLFMPVKYYESFAKGLQEYNKDKRQQQNDALKQENDLLKFNAEQGYKNKSLGIQQSQLEVSEANAITSATNVKRQEEKDNAQESQNRINKIKDNILNINKNITSLIDKKAGAFDDKTKQEIQSQIDGQMRELKSEKRNMMHLDPDLSDEAINTALDIMDQVQRTGDTGIQTGIGGGYGVVHPTYNAVSREAQLVKDWADKKGIANGAGQSLDVNAIDQMIQANSLEKVIQALIGKGK